jgi:beta-glucosidase
MADVKHFAVNNQEGQDPSNSQSRPGAPPPGWGPNGLRYLDNAVVADRTLHEIYFPQFQAAIQEAHSATVMCSYNKINGTYACENPGTLLDVLRGQWGFRGYVVADYGAAHNTIASLNHGLDFEPWPPFAYRPFEIDAALVSGRVSQGKLDDHVRNTLATWFRYGVFDRHAYRNSDRQINKHAHARDAIRIEEQAITLLRNHGGLLPLRSRRLRRVAVIGKDANAFVTGGGSGNVVPFHFTSLLAAIRARVGRHVKVTYDDGSSPGAAAADAKRADVAVVDVGDYYTEGVDRSCLTLECPDNNGDQDGLIQKVARANRHTVVVLESGGPDLTPWRSRVAGLVEAWYPGGPGAIAVARVLFGDSDPGGRLPVTFPASPSQIPTAGDPMKYPGVGNNTYYKEGVLVGYRWYDAKHERPAYPFGFGLSFTSFRFSRLRIARLAGTGRYAVRLTVSNVGRRRGWVVPELYVHVRAPRGLVEPPFQLKGFAKVSLAPRERRTVTIQLDRRSFSYWNSAAQRWLVQPGCDPIAVGSSSRALVLRGRIGLGGARC